MGVIYLAGNDQVSLIEMCFENYTFQMIANSTSVNEVSLAASCQRTICWCALIPIYNSHALSRSLLTHWPLGDFNEILDK